MGKRGAISLSAAILLVAMGLSAPAASALGRLPFQVLLNADGSGEIFMNNGSTPSWQVCKPDLSACTPFATGSFNTGSAPPESAFWAGGELVTPLWRGTVRELTPPSVKGNVRGNEVITPEAGTWAGGWANDYDSLSLSICKNASGEHCLQVNHEGPEKRCGPEGATLIDPAFTGWFLRVVDRRYGAGTIFAGVGHPAYYPVGAIEPQATVSTAIAGRIAPPSGPPSVDCGPGQLFTASIASDGSAEAACRLIGCRATLIARCCGRTFVVKRKLPPAPFGYIRIRRGHRIEPGTATLRLPPAALERLEGHPVRIAVRLNGRAVARRTIRLGPLPVVAVYPEDPDGS